MVTMKPKEALLQDGKVTVSSGRGRLSREAKERIAELVDLGWDIEGYSNSTPTVKAAKPKAKTVKTKSKRASVEYDDIVTLMPYRFPLDQFKAVSEVPIFGATEFSMREACNFCGVSLCVHVCDEPKVLGYPVSIVPV